MKIGTIIAGLAMLCFLTGCTKKPPPKDYKSHGPHSLKLEASSKVIVDQGHTATATWQGGTPPYTIKWSLPTTLGRFQSREATSPDTIEFEITASKGNIGQRYNISVSITDADGKVSNAYEQFILANDPLKSRSGGLRSPTP